MHISSKKTLRTALYSIAMAVVAGCIGSPFPAGTVAELYHWDDLDRPVATRAGESSQELNGYFDGDFSFSDLLSEQPQLASDSSQPWMIRACHIETCYSLVVFGDSFRVSDRRVLTGYASLSALSTTMANQVRDLPSAEVRDALEALSTIALADNSGSYNDFIALDPERKPAHRDMLAQQNLNESAQDLIAVTADATFDQLMAGLTQTTESLEVPDGFLFDGSQLVSIEVDVSSRLSEEAYLLICTDFERQGQNYDVDFGACQLSTPLRNGAYEGELTLTDSVKELLAVILPLEDPDNASYARWNRASDGGNFIVN